MKRIVRQMLDDQKVADISHNQDSSVLDVDVLLDKGGEILRREIANLMVESSGRKLSAASARDLVAYIRLLSDLQKEQKSDLSKLTDEDLVSLASQAEPSEADPQKSR